MSRECYIRPEGDDGHVRRVPAAWGRDRDRGGRDRDFAQGGGFHNPGWSAAVLAGYGLSIWMLTVVVKQMPVSVAYAVWAGAGTALVAVVGLLFMGEHLNWIKAPASR